MATAVDTGLYKVPKEGAVIEIKIPPLAPERKTIFLSSCAGSHGGKETVSDILNTPRAFLPLLDGPGALTLARREAIHWVRVEDPERVEWYYYETRQGSPCARVRFGFDDGDAQEGVVYAAGPAGEQRIQDVVNRKEEFLHLDAGTGLYLVNLRQVARIMVLERGVAGP